METLYLVDSHSLIFQVFHGIPSMTSPTGVPTNAVFGFTRDLMALRGKKPDYLICGWDLPEPTFRNHIFQEYKAHREAIPPDLLIQFPLIQQTLEALSIPVVACAGFEADDVLATIAELAKKKGMRVFICTSDKDYRQLIDNQVSLYSLRKQQEYGSQELQRDWGITPEQVVDLQTLVGDSADNIPGADGIGVKTAASLLGKYGTIEEIYKNLGNISGVKRKENLLAFQPQIPLVRKLVTLERNIPLVPDWENWKMREMQAQKGRDLFHSLGFRGFTSQMEKLLGVNENLGLFAAAPSPETISTEKETALSEPVRPPTRLTIEFPLKLKGAEGWVHDYELVQSEEAFSHFFAQLEKTQAFAFDTETTGLDPFQSELAGIAFCWEEARAYYLSFKAPFGNSTLGESALNRLKPIFENSSIKKANQNIKFDYLILKNLGIKLRGISGDSMIADYLLHSGERSHGLSELAKKHLNHQMIEITELIGVKGKGKTQLRMDEVDPQLAALYACEDADGAWRLTVLLEKALGEALGDGDKGKLFTLYQRWEIPLIEVLAEMQWQGTRVDQTFLRRVGKEMELELMKVEGEIHHAAGKPFQITSLPQLRKVLYEELNLPALRKTGISKATSTDQETLEKLAALNHPGSYLAQKVLEYRQISKLKSTYVDSLPKMVHPKTERVHAFFNQTVAATGRLSSSNPNLQNIPIRREMGQQIRKAFIPREGWTLVCADYSQIELRLLAHFCLDQNLLNAFRENRDIHAQVASEIYSVPETLVTPEMRRNAKTVNFGIIYGISAHGLSQRLRISRKEAGEFIDSYLKNFPSVLAYQESVLDKCRKTGFVTTLLGRRRRIEGVRDRSTYQQRNQPEREAINMEIQGSAADLVKMAMVGTHQALVKNKCSGLLLMQIHDELVIESPKEETQLIAEILRTQMGAGPEKELGLRVPLVVDISSGGNWLEQTPL